MSVANGRSYLAIPGPSVMPDAVLRAMHRASPNIYEGELLDMMAGILADLRYVARTETAEIAMYICNGHGLWEAALANTIEPGDKVLVPTNGAFGHGWAETAACLGAEVAHIEFGLRSAFDAGRIAEALRNDHEHKIKAVLAVHVDTSTSLRNDIRAIRKAIDDAGHPALLMCDCIASLGCDRFEMDAWGVDLMIVASQKGLMVPPGMGFVFANPRALQRRKEIHCASRYWDLTDRISPEGLYHYFCGTAPTHHLYGLRASLDMIRAEGMDVIWARHATLAGAIWAAVDHWGQGGDIALNVPDRASRSHAVTSLTLGEPKVKPLRDWCDANAGVTLGINIGMSSENDPEGASYFRLGHMGHVNAHMVLGALGVLESGLKALGIQHASGGVTAATNVISEA